MRRWGALLFVCLLLGGTATLVADDSTGVGCICGEVLEAKTREPIPFAVLVLDSQMTVALADSGGGFRIEGVRIGLHSLQAFHEGFVGRKGEFIHVIGDSCAWKQLHMEVEVITFYGYDCSITPRDILLRTEACSIKHLTTDVLRRQPAASVYDILRKRGGVTVR